MRIGTDRFNSAVVRSAIARQTEVSDAATPFGCCAFFDECADGIFSLYYRGVLDLLDWMGFVPTDTCYRSVEFINYLRPEQSGGADTPGYISDPCEDPHGTEFGECSLTVDDFGRYGREGPVRDLMKSKKWCKISPRFFLDGTPVDSEAQWDMFFAMDQLLTDIRKALVTGNATTAGQFDGLERWVRTGYDCASLDSYVINWNGNPMAGGNGITINGAAIANTWDIIDVLLDVFRNIMERVSWSPLLRQQQGNMREGDVIILLPGFLARCLLDFFTCWSVCGGAQYEIVTKDAKEMREFRLTLNGGMFGDGQIMLDGFTIPLLQYDWELVKGPKTGDMYLLTGAIGQNRVWEGEHLDANTAVREALEGYNSSEYSSLDGGRVLTKGDVNNLCAQKKLWMFPRLFCMAPWAQVRFQNVQCETPTGPLSPDPSETSFYPETCFNPAECP